MNTRLIDAFFKVRFPVRYWGRKPINECVKLVEKYSDNNDIILDSFGGAGSIVLAALLAGRRSIYLDINPYAWLIAYVLINSVQDVEKYGQAAEEILNRSRLWFKDLEGRRHWISRDKLWSVFCPECGRKINVDYYEWDLYRCRAVLTCGHIIELPDLTGVPVYSFPRDHKLYYPDGSPFYKRRDVDYIHQLFTNRALLILSAMLKDIDKVARKQPDDVALALYLTFASILYDASKMARKGAGSWGVPCYWVPLRHIEKNPYELFRNRTRILVGWFKKMNEVKRRLDVVVTTDIKKVLNNDAKVSIHIGSALKLTELLPEESIDLVLTDPPHVDEVQYLELSYMYIAWLLCSTYFPKLFKKTTQRALTLDFEEELTVNPKRGKTIKTYLRKIEEFSKQAYTILNRKKRMLLILHEEDKKLLNNIVQTFKHRFNITKIENVFETCQRKIGEKREEGRQMETYLLTVSDV